MYRLAAEQGDASGRIFTWALLIIVAWACRRIMPRLRNGFSSQQSKVSPTRRTNLALCTRRAKVYRRILSWRTSGSISLLHRAFHPQKSGSRRGPHDTGSDRPSAALCASLAAEALNSHLSITRAKRVFTAPVSASNPAPAVALLRAGRGSLTLLGNREPVRMTLPCPWP